ncbi:MAG: T9SS type A sorting domain-containing protein [Vicingaceae bacterium]|nr:T9SS type A sorting domain-containing protein [Vicingaceae bacterium]
MELILPELVSNHTFPAQYDSLGNQTSAAVSYKGLNYNAFIAILMKGMQNQQSQIDSMNVLVVTQDSINTSLENRLAVLEACINNIGLCNNNGGGNNNKISAQTVTLENVNAIILQQNLPNPFAESTQINYVLPDDVMNAKMLFYDMNGRIINEVTINERGNGTLTVYGENLEKGIYTYSLIADGKLIATKKMVKK